MALVLNFFPPFYFFFKLKMCNTVTKMSRFFFKSAKLVSFVAYIGVIGKKIAHKN